MNIEVLEDSGSVAERAASVIADHAWEAIGARGLFIMAVSGGRTPWIMLRWLAAAHLPWRAVHIFQVDERVAPAGHTDRNLSHLRENLLDSPLPPDQLYAMPVESPDLEAGAACYAASLRSVAGDTPVIDLVHLGLGPDGHTASLVPGDPVLDVVDADVALSGPYQGRRRMTLTYPTLNRARSILWVVTGREKAGMVNRLMDGDRGIPAGRVSRAQALLLADCPAGGQRTGKTGEVVCA
ncbi:MAG TPA: 6-phosphogluconolactonase [Bryobacteraceae bacterium]|nr:6-phosphogluconolactonase [Bryobacteraceae bacterium]